MTLDEIADRLSDAQREFDHEASHAYFASEDRTFAEMITRTISRLIVCLRENRLPEAKIEALTFSRQITDTYAECLPSLRLLSGVVTDASKALQATSR